MLPSQWKSLKQHMLVMQRCLLLLLTSRLALMELCVGGDGVVNEVLNGLLGRDDLKEAIQLPIGIIPTGSDNSLLWTVLGIKDPVSVAMNLAKGGFTPIDVFAVKRMQAGATHFGLTAPYYGFVADVLQLSENFRLQFGPFRYVIASLLRFLSLPKYRFEVDYLPLSRGRNSELASLPEKYHGQPCDCRVVEKDIQFDGTLKDNWVTRKGEFLGIFVAVTFASLPRGYYLQLLHQKLSMMTRAWT